MVGEKSLLVDQSYHVLRPRGLPELRAIEWLDNSSVSGRPPDCLEFALAYPRGRYGGVRLTALRVPFPPEARASALAVYGHFAPKLVRKPSIALRNPRRTVQVSAAVFAASLAACAAGWIMAEATGWSLDATVVPMILLIVGSIVGPTSLMVGLFTLLVTRGGRGYR